MPTSKNSRPRIGAHTPTSGGMAKRSIAYAELTQAEAIQVFTSNPRGWAMPETNHEADALFREKADALDIEVYVHAHLAGNDFSAGVHFLAPTIGFIEPFPSTVKVQDTCALAPVTILIELNHVVEFFPVSVSTIQSSNGIVHAISIKVEGCDGHSL